MFGLTAGLSAIDAMPAISPAGPQRRTEEVVFRDQESQLAGELTLPTGSPPYPALAMIHGSGPADRTNFGFFPPIRDTLVDHGMAVLCYDKPGVGASGGDWTNQSFPEDRVAEALAAVGYLSAREDLDSSRIGLWGVSQGGWIVPLAASRSDAVSFLIVVAAPGVTPREQNAFDAQTRLRRAGHPEQVIEETGRFVRKLMDAAQEGWSYSRLRRELLDPARGEPWYDSFSLETEDNWAFLARSDSGFDPRPVLEQVTCPVLCIYGEDDALVPVDTSVEVFENALSKAGNTRFEIHVFPRADHQVCLPEKGFAPGYLELMGEWAAQVVGTA